MSFEDIAEMQLFGNQLVNVADLGGVTSVL